MNIIESTNLKDSMLSMVGLINSIDTSCAIIAMKDHESFNSTPLFLDHIPYQYVR